MNSSIKTFIRDRKLALLLLGLLLLLIIGLVLLIWKRSTFNEENFRAILKEASLEYEGHNYSKAMDLYLQASEVAQAESEPYKGIIKILGEKGYYTEASELITDISAGLNENDVASLYEILATTQQARTDYPVGYESASRAYSKDPSPTRALLAAELAVQAGQVGEVKMYLDDLPDGLNAEFTAMWDLYSRAIEAEGEDVDLFSVVGNSRDFIIAGYPALAHSLLTTYEEDMENYWEGLYYLGRAMYELEEYEEALTRLESAVSLGSDDNILYLYLARTYQAIDQPTSAYEIYERSIAFSGDDEGVQILDEYVSLLIENGQYNRALDWVDDFSDQEQSLILYMRIYSKWEDWDEFEVYAKQSELASVSSEHKVEYLSMMLDYQLLVTEELEGVDDMLDILASEKGYESLVAYYSGLRSKVLGEEEQSEQYFEEAIDKDVSGQVTELVKQFI